MFSNWRSPLEGGRSQFGPKQSDDCFMNQFSKLISDDAWDLQRKLDKYSVFVYHSVFAYSVLKFAGL